MATSTMNASAHTPHAHACTSSRQQRSTPTARSTSVHPPAAAGRTLSPSTARTPGDRLTKDVKTQSPSYFGLAVDSSHQDACNSNEAHARQHWSPPTSHVRSAAATSPRIVPLDENPEFEAFRRQAELNKNNFGGNLGGGRPFGSLSGFSAKSAQSSSDISRTTSTSSGRPSMSHQAPKEGAGNYKPVGDDQSPQQRSPKRSLPSPILDVTDRPRRNSPASFTDRDESLASQPARFADDKRVDRSLPSASGTPFLTNRTASFKRGETLPIHLDAENASEDGPTFVTPQHVVGLLDTSSEDVLLLDVRVSTQYARSSIAGALNLCIPTTLLKRATFTVQKLAETFKDPEQRARFERWRSSRYIVVYDQSTSQMKDATTCVNTLKKFASENWNGGSYIIRGGFEDFSSKFPRLVSKGANSSGPAARPALSLSTDRPEVAPVVGGCPMPTTKNAANPFFGNIRQNMDLIGGVGQMPLKKPANLTQHMEEQFPEWVKRATDSRDNGKVVSDKFLALEKLEQKRMQDALSANVTYAAGSPLRSPRTPLSPSGMRRAPGGRVQIAGIEKGTKNRYNNIWPYEHSRVKLQDVSQGECDYVNANHVKARWTSKRYIATQGPIPATFAVSLVSSCIFRHCMLKCILQDFWRMIWQQDIRVIVMLTAEKEGGQVKAHNYWQEGKYDNLVLTYLSEHRASLEPDRIHAHYRGGQSLSPASSQAASSQIQTSHSNSTSKQLGRQLLGQRRATVTNPPPSNTPTDPAPPNEQPYVIVRRFTLSRADRPFERMREITQLQYTNWPDFGAPAHPAHLLGLVEQCDAVVRQSQGGNYASPAERDRAERREEVRPIAVHCSAGCGRTGTFCTVDSVVDLLRKQRAYKERKEREAKADRRKDLRERTPMDVDSPASAGLRKSFDLGRMSVDGGGERTPFFAAADGATPVMTPKTPKPAAAAAAADGGENDWIDHEDIDLVEKVVEEFRMQRLSMVQSLRQFVLCYESVMEWLAGQMPKTA